MTFKPSKDSSKILSVKNLNEFYAAFFKFLDISLAALFLMRELCYRTEKNACAWSQDKLKELLLNMKIEGDGG